MSAWLRTPIVPFLVVLLFSGTSHAQVTTATLYAIVTDPSNAVVPGAEITLTEERTGVVRQQTCNDVGECAFTFVTPGSYTVAVSAPGFKILNVSGLRLQSGQNLRRTFALEVGNVVETVSVSAEAPMINTVSAEQQESFDSTILEQMPLSRRRATELLSIGTATNRVGGTGNISGSFVLNGLGGGGASVSMDGIPASAHPGTPQAGYRGGFSYIEVTTIEAIEEVDVSKGVFSAEYGRGLTGNVNFVTKSGTNEWHGSLFHLLNTEELNARPVFLTTKPAATFNQFGGSLGGPIFKNRVFIFGAYEGYRERRGRTVNDEVPTQLLRDQMLAAVPDYQLVLDEWFLPNQPHATDALTARYIGPASFSAEQDHLVVKPDVWLGSSAKISGTWVRDRPENSIPRGAGPRQFRTFTGTMDRFNITFTALKDIWSAETRYGWSQVDNDRLDRYFELQDPQQEETRFGGRRVPGVFGPGFGTGGESNFIGNAPHWNIEQKFTFTFGQHSLKVGGLLSRRRLGQANVEVPELRYNTFEELLANTPVRARFTFGFNPWVGRQLDGGFFVQDDWRVNRKLVLNLGLRYDYFDNMYVEGLDGGFPHLVNMPFTDFPTFTLGERRPFDNAYDSDPMSLGPRFGFAYNPDASGKTVFRGGFAAMHTPVNVTIFEQTPVNGLDEPFRVDISKTEIEALGIQFPFYNEDALPLVKGGQSGRAFQLVDPSINTPYAMNYTFGIQRQLSSTLMLETAFVGNRGVKLILPRIYNQSDPLTGVRPNPELGESRYWDNSDSSNYNAWQTSLRKRYSENLAGSLHYTWGKTLAYQDADTTYGIGPDIQDFFDVRSNRGRPSFSNDHTLIGNFLYDLPLFSTSPSLLRKILGGWQTSGIFEVLSGSPLTVTQRTARAYGRPDLLDFDNAILDQGGQYLNPAAFADVFVSEVSGQQIRAGTAGHGGLTGPGRWNFDFALAKNVRFTETTQLQFRADMLNVFNHVDLVNISNRTDRSNFGQRTGATDSREIQLYLRLTF